MLSVSIPCKKGIICNYPRAKVMASLSLWFNRFVVTTDHESLKYFCDQQDLKGRKARWADLI